MVRRLPPLALPLVAAAIAVVVLLPSDWSVTGLPASTQLSARPGYAAIAMPEAVISDPVPAAGAPAGLSSSPAAETSGLPAVASPPATRSELAPDSNRTRVVGSAVNVRSGPSTSTAKLFVLQPGEEVAVTETLRGWVQIETGTGDAGWVYSRYLSGSDTAETGASAAEGMRQAKPKSARVDAAVALRAGPSRTAPRLFVLHPNEQIVIAEVRGRWIRVVMESGVSGWIQTRDLPR